MSFDIASHDHHASHINTHASPVPSMQPPTPNGRPQGPVVHSASRPMDYCLPHISPPCPNYSPHPKMDNGLSHPSGFPATASTCIPVLHPSNHCLRIPSHIPVAARTQGMAKGPSRPSNIEPQHSPIPATTNAHTSPCCLPPPNDWTMGRLAHSTSLPSDRRYLHLNVTSHATTTDTCPCHRPACASEWPTGPLIHSTLCPRGRPHTGTATSERTPEPNEQPISPPCPLDIAPPRLSPSLSQRQLPAHTLLPPSDYLHPTMCPTVGEQIISPIRHRAQPLSLLAPQRLSLMHAPSHRNEYPQLTSGRRAPFFLASYPNDRLHVPTLVVHLGSLHPST